MTDERPDGVTLGAFAVLILLAGGNAVGIWFSNRELAPFWGASVRFGVAAAAFAGFALFTHRPLPRGVALAGAAAYGALGFGVFYVGAYWGILHVAPGTAQVILALVPLLTFLLAVAERQEPFAWRGLWGALVAAAGIVLVFREQFALDVEPLALAALVMAGVAAAQAALVAKRYARGDAVTTNAVAMAVGAAMLLTLSAALREPWLLPARGPTWAALAYLVLAGSVAVFALYLFVVRRWTASGTSYQFVLIPFVTVTASAWLVGERLTPGLLAGAALVLVGVYVGALRR